jgi:hypothetical protein
MELLSQVGDEVHSGELKRLQRSLGECGQKIELRMGGAHGKTSMECAPERREGDDWDRVSRTLSNSMVPG